MRFTGPATLDLLRDGDNHIFNFKANGATLYTTGTHLGDFYDTWAKDALVYYQIVIAGDGDINATVDDFGPGLASASVPKWCRSRSRNQSGNADVELPARRHLRCRVFHGSREKDRA